jgi:Adenylosuccinate lyase C-terminus/Lyase/impB/mucB/samB family
MRARELCPQLIFVGGHFQDYQRLGDAAINVLGDFTPLVERISIDEAFADVVGCTHLFGSPPEIARAVRLVVCAQSSASQSQSAWHAPSTWRKLLRKWPNLMVVDPEVPVSTWHVARDGLAETINLLGLITGSLGKIALDIMIMASTEFAEVYEPFVKGRGASSTMPQKRNPISSELMLAAAKAVRQHAGLMLDATIHDFERATGPWHAEWIAIPESFVLTAGALHQAKFALGGLIVDERQMQKNLDLSRGLIVAEAVMMGLAPQIGRQQAHDVVYDACRLVNEKGGSLSEALIANPEISGRIDQATIDRLTTPRNYLGQAPQMVDRVLASAPRGN